MMLLLSSALHIDTNRIAHRLHTYPSAESDVYDLRVFFRRQSLYITRKVVGSIGQRDDDVSSRGARVPLQRRRATQHANG